MLRVTRPITRCPATEVNPETAERDADPVAELRRLYGHVELGVHAEVIEGGRFAVGRCDRGAAGVVDGVRVCVACSRWLMS